jgi:hypothetical protein
MATASPHSLFIEDQFNTILVSPPGGQFTGGFLTRILYLIYVPPSELHFEFIVEKFLLLQLEYLEDYTHEYMLHYNYII